MGQSFRIVNSINISSMKMFVVLALAASACAEPEADPALVLSSAHSPLLSAFNTYNALPSVYSHAVAAPAVSYKAVATPAVAYKAVVTPAVTYNTAAVSPLVYAQPQVASHTVTNYNSPTHYTAVSNGAYGPSYIAKNGPVQHIVKREAEAEADADAFSVYNNLPLTYNTAVNTYSHAVATPFVKAVAPAVAYNAAVPAVTYKQAVATPAVIYKAVATPAVTYKAVATPAVTYNTAVVNPVVYAQPQVASHTVTSYKTPTHYTAVSNGAYGPQYIAKNGPVQHIVKREAEADAEADANHHYLANGVYTPTVYNHAVATPAVYNYAVALTPYGATHSSNVGVCTNNLGAVVPC